MDKKQLMVIEKYTQPLFNWSLKKENKILSFENWTQIKGIFEETGLANFF